MIGSSPEPLTEKKKYAASSITESHQDHCPGLISIVLVTGFSLSDMRIVGGFPPGVCCLFACGSGVCLLTKSDNWGSCVYFNLSEVALVVLHIRSPLAPELRVTKKLIPQ